jgi:hypothetical protein
MAHLERVVLRNCIFAEKGRDHDAETDDRHREGDEVENETRREEADLVGTSA